MSAGDPLRFRLWLSALQKLPSIQNFELLSRGMPFSWWQEPAATSRWLLLGSSSGLKLKAAEADPRCRCAELDLDGEAGPPDFGFGI